MVLPMNRGVLVRLVKHHFGRLSPDRDTENRVQIDRYSTRKG